MPRLRRLVARPRSGVAAGFLPERARGSGAARVIDGGQPGRAVARRRPRHGRPRTGSATQARRRLRRRAAGGGRRSGQPGRGGGGWLLGAGPLGGEARARMPARIGGWRGIRLTLGEQAGPSPRREPARVHPPLGAAARRHARPVAAAVTRGSALLAPRAPSGNTEPGTRRRSVASSARAVPRRGAAVGAGPLARPALPRHGSPATKPLRLSARPKRRAPPAGAAATREFAPG